MQGHTTDKPFTVPPPGVLANDTDIENNSLSAILVTPPVFGAVTLNANGSFTYTPAPTFVGTDNFTYKANDGSADSNAAAVTINVVDVTPPTTTTLQTPPPSANGWNKHQATQRQR